MIEACPRREAGMFSVRYSMLFSSSRFWRAARRRRTLCCLRSRCISRRSRRASTRDQYVGAFLNKTDCSPRSDGCQTATLQCVLASTIGYTSDNVFMQFTVVIADAADTTMADGMINFTITYTFANLFPVNGIVQLWREHRAGPRDGGARLRVHEAPSAVDELPGYAQWHTFFDVAAGQYLLVIGQRRHALRQRHPETSDVLTVSSVFPFSLVNQPLVPRLMVQNDDFAPYAGGQCVDINFPTNNMFLEFP